MWLLFILCSLLLFHGECHSADLEAINEIKSTESNFLGLSLYVDNENAYLCGSVTVDHEYFLKGMIAKIDQKTGEIKWEKKIDDNDKTIRPQIIRVFDNLEIELISELSLVRTNFTYANQIVNVRKYTKDGELISNYSDSSKYEKAVKAKFPIGYNNDYNGISVYYTPQSQRTQAFSYAVHLDKKGNYTSSCLIDSSALVNQDTVDRYLIKGFENYDSGVYAYGVKHIIRGNDEVRSSYIMKLDSNDNILWKIPIGPENKYYTISNICVTADNDVIVVGFKGDLSGMAYKISEDGQIEWSKNLGDSNCLEIIENIIQNVSGDLIIVGRATDKGTETKENLYLAKLDVNGNLIWQIKEPRQSVEYFTDIVEYSADKYYISSIRGTSAVLYKFEDPDVSVEEQNTAPEVNVLEYADYYDIENNRLYDKAELVSIRGTVLKSMDISDKFNFQLQKDNYFRGVFFLRLSGKKGTLVKKLIY